MKTLLENFPRLQDWYNIGPVQRAELEEFMMAVIASKKAVTADGKLVAAGDQLWVLSSTDMPQRTHMQTLEATTDYYLFGNVPVSHSFSSKTAAVNYLKEKYAKQSR